MKHFLYIFLISVFLLGTVAGCDAQNAPAIPDARSVVCRSLTDLRSAVVNLGAINPETPVADVRAMKANVDKLVEATRRANSVLQIQPVTDMVSSYDSFSNTVNGLNPDQHVGDAAAALHSSSERILDALDQAYSSAQCVQ